jgi:outer membrane protein assembly factor BamA
MKSHKNAALIVSILFLYLSGSVATTFGEEKNKPGTNPNERTVRLSCPPRAGDMDLGDLLRKLLKKKESDKQKHGSLLILPIISNSPSVGLSFGAAVGAVGYRQTQEQNVSSLIASMSFSIKGQFLMVSRSDFHVGNDFWHLIGDWRFYNYTERTYGLGSDTPADVYTDTKFKWFRFAESVLVPVSKHLDVGGKYDLEMYHGIKQTDTSSGDGGNANDFGDGNTRASGAGLAAIYDNTDNRINASRGVYAAISYTFYPVWMGSNSAWQAVDAQAKWYVRLPTCRRQVLAFWGLTEMVTTGVAPYFDLPSNGWDLYNRSTRGYAAGRFRGPGWLYGEMEYRTDLTQNGLLGAVAFVNVSSFSKNDAVDFERAVFGGGLGLRIKVNKKTESNLALDFGVGEEGSHGLYFAFNEAF